MLDVGEIPGSRADPGFGKGILDRHFVVLEYKCGVVAELPQILQRLEHVLLFAVLLFATPHGVLGLHLGA